MNDTTERVLTVPLVTMALEHGLLDDGLDAIKAALDYRVERIQSRKAAELNKGDIFTIENCSPKKWNGHNVVFDRRDGIWLVCTLDQAVASRFRLASNTIRLRDCHVGSVYSS